MMTQETFEHTYGNGQGVRYRRMVSGTCYHADTPETVIDLLEHLRQTQRKVRIFYGDFETGRSWLDEHDCIGRIGRSMGPIKVPLLVEEGQCGGSALLDHCILRIDTPRRVLYRHPDFHIGVADLRKGNLKRLPWEVLIDEAVHARFRSKPKAVNFIDFLLGKRFACG